MSNEPRGEPESPAANKTLVLVTGAGRSGTSTVAGTLHHLGYHVPQPVLKSNSSNPRGFYESTWPLWFHRRIMDAAGIEQIDGRPEAAALMTEAVTPEVRAELQEWLGQEMLGHERVVVKDPRSAWVPQLWEDTGASLGVTVRYLTMLRHPAEILGSRSTHYGQRVSMEQWSFSVMNLCGWINVNLVCERRTRQMSRTWIRYTDLLADWRGAMSATAETLGLEYDAPLEVGRHHPVDDFIDVDLRRHVPDWSGLDIPDELREIAESVWEAGGLLADGHGHDAQGESMLDEARLRYDRLFRNSVAIARDDTLAKTKAARREARTALRRELDEKAAKAAAERDAAPDRIRRMARRLRRRLS